MNLRKQSTEMQVERAVLESHDALGIFVSTIHKLKEANHKLEEARQIDHARIEELKANVERASLQETKNNQLITSIQNLLGE